MISPAPIPTLRLVLRIASAFALDLLAIYRGDRDFADALLLAALMQRKSAGLSGEWDCHRSHADFDAPVPQDLRGPISINALAQSLGLPFETVRRRAKRLIADGLCEPAHEGVRISAEMLASEGHRDALDAVYETTRALYLRLARAHCVQLMELPPRPVEDLGADTRPVGIVWRASSDYVLRIMELLLPHFSNLTQAFILLEVVRANTEGMPDALRGDDRLNADGAVPDAYRRPVRAGDVARRLKLPHETVRRNLAALIEDGRCQHVREGYIVPAVVLAQPNVLAAFAPNFQNLRRMFTNLAAAGVLARWDAERMGETAA